MDAYLRDRAEKLGANIINGLMMKMEQPGGRLCVQLSGPPESAWLRCLLVHRGYQHPAADLLLIASMHTSLCSC
jgi:hypothetical protein